MSAKTFVYVKWRMNKRQLEWLLSRKKQTRNRKCSMNCKHQQKITLWKERSSLRHPFLPYKKKTYIVLLKKKEKNWNPRYG